MALRNLISNISFSIIFVNCAFLAVRYFSVAAELFAISLRCFALLLKVKLTCDQGLCPLDTHHPLKSVDVNFIWLRSAVLFLIIGRNFLQFQYIQFLHFAEGIFGDYFTSA